MGLGSTYACAIESCGAKKFVPEKCPLAKGNII